MYEVQWDMHDTFKDFRELIQAYLKRPCFFKDILGLEKLNKIFPDLCIMLADSVMSALPYEIINSMSFDENAPKCTISREKSSLWRSRPLHMVSTTNKK